MLTPDEIADWKAADKVLTELLELQPEQREAAARQKELSPQVRLYVDELVRANEDQGMLDFDLVPSLRTAPQGSLAGQRFGPWRLTDEIGRGGMAVVYRAEREGSSFEQSVAVKLLPRGMTGHERFKNEQQILARLEHPNIARLLDGGVSADGTPWLAMELVTGQAISRYCAGLGVHEIVRKFLDVVDAVAYAHSLLVIHRDLKPGNVLVDQAGRVRLLDFGIARFMSTEDNGAVTRVLTSEFGAPEQFDGSEISTATDVFGLGAVLHALVSCQPPRNRDGSWTRSLESSRADADLKNIISKALREEPSARYSTAQAMGEDLQRWLDGLPVLATAGNRRYLAGKWLRRHRVGAATSALVLLATIGAVAVMLWQAGETRKQLRISQATTDFLVQLFDEADPVVAQGRPTTARELLSRAEKSLEGIDDPLIRDELTLAMARAYFGMGDYTVARELLGHGLASGLDDRSLATRLLYAQALYSSGETAAATEFLDQLALPERHSIEVRRMLGRYFSSGAEYARADAELTSAQSELNQSTPVVEHVKLLAAVAMNHIWQARYEQALQALDDAGTVAENNELWSEQAELARLSGQVAEIQGRHADALDEYVAARMIYEQVYSADHSIMIDLAKSEAQALSKLGRQAEAIERLQAASELARQRLGDNPGTVEVLNSQSIAYEQVGDLDKAIELGMEAESMMVRLGNSEHPLRANLLANIANYHITLGQYDRAEALTHQAETILRQSLPQDHPVFIHTQFQLARIFSRRGQTGPALELMLDLVPRALESPGPGNHLTISIQRDLGRQYLRLDDLAEAIAWMQQAAEAAASFPDDSLLRLYVELGLAEASLRAGKPDQTQALLDRLTPQWGSQGSSPDGQTVYTEALLALHQSDTAKAVQLLSQTEELMEKEPDNGTSYRPEVQLLKARLASVN